MTRNLRIAAGQLGPIQREDRRSSVIARLMTLMHKAKDKRCDLIVFPEMALSTFFPRWQIDDTEELDRFYDEAMPNPSVQSMFDFARENEIGFYLGYSEIERNADQVHRYNTAITVNKSGEIVGKYRKIHLPGHIEPNPERSHQHMEKRYFEVGNLGFPVFEEFGGNVGMALCNDRRWPETYRMLSMQDVELTLIGYNTPTTDSLSDERPDLRFFHSQLVMQAGAYQNSTWVVGVAKAGVENGYPLMAGTCIVSPTGEIVASSRTEEDELVVADCDLDLCNFYKQNIFNFAAHRRPEEYGLITERAGRMNGPDRIEKTT